MPYNEDKTKFNGYTIFIKDGYECIYPNSKFKYVHRLIVEEDIGRELDLNEDVHHDDENRRNNSRSNLKIKDHALHAKEHYESLSDEEKARRTALISKKTRGSKNSQAKLTEGKVLEILQLVVSENDIQEVADQYEVHYTTIWDIWKKRTWKHVQMGV